MGQTDSNRPAPAPTRVQIAAVIAGNGLEFYDFVTYSFFAAQIGRTLFPQAHGNGLLLSLATFGVGFVTRPLGGFVIGRIADRRAQAGDAADLHADGRGVDRHRADPALRRDRHGRTAACGRLPHAAGLRARWRGRPEHRLPVGGRPCRAARAVHLVPIWDAESGGAGGGRRRPRLVVVAVAGRARCVGLARGVPAWCGDRAVRPAPAPHARRDAAGSGRRDAGEGGRIVPARRPGRRDADRGRDGRTYTLNYLATYAQATLHMQVAAAFGATAVLGLSSMTAGLTGGWLSDRFGRKRALVVPWFALVVLTVPLFMLIARFRTSVALFVATAVMGCLLNLATGPALTLLIESLSARVRAGALGLIYALSVAVFGGSTQLIATVLTRWMGSPLAPAWYMSGALLIGSVGIFMLKETRPGRAGEAVARSVA